MNDRRDGFRPWVVAATAAVLVACGGSTVSSERADSGPKSADAGAPQDSGGGDAKGRRDASALDAASTDAPGGADASDAASVREGGHQPVDAGGLCVTPVLDGGSTVAGCREARCPTGTVCIQIEEDVTSHAKCVSIPSACAGRPTCACMGAEAVACGRPGTRFIDAGIGPGTCQDEGDAGGSYLDLPCGCA